MSDTSVWLGLFPNEIEAKTMAIPGGEKPEDIHLTLAYLGDYTKQSGLVKNDLLNVLSDIIYYRDETPDNGNVTGYGYFLHPKVFFAIPSVNGLLEFRQYLVQNLPTYSKKYSYTPHMSLVVGSNYLHHSTMETPLSFEGVTLMHGEEKILIPWSN